MATSFAAYRRWRGFAGRAETIVLPTDGFLGVAALFGPLWALGRRCWRAAAILGAGWLIAGLLAYAVGPEGVPVIWFVVAMWGGVVARGLEADSLADQGWRLQDIVMADGREMAESKLIAADALASDSVERRW